MLKEKPFTNVKPTFPLTLSTGKMLLLTKTSCVNEMKTQARTDP